jgi:hypothetical protein
MLDFQPKDWRRNRKAETLWLLKHNKQRVSAITDILA